MHLLRPDTNDLDVLLGEPRRAIITMFVPFLIALAIVEVNQFVDTFWVSGLGTNSAEAVATVVPIYGLMMCAGIGIGVGSTTAISFRLGKGDTGAAERLVSSSFILGAIFAISVSVIVFLLFDPVIEMMGAQEVRDESWRYMVPLLVLSPALLIDSIIGATLRGEGAARKATIVQISAALFNMAIDPILIYGLGMGVMGAGLSTAISAILSICIGLYWYLSGRTEVRLNRCGFRPDHGMMTEILTVGGPKTAQSLISNATDLVQRVFLIMAGGVTAVMLYNYPWRYIGLVNLPGRAFENAMVPVCSAAYGQSDKEKMRIGYLYTLKLSICLSILFSMVLFVLAEPFMSVLTYEDSMHELLPRFVWTMRVSVLLIPFSALMGIGSSMMQSMKRAKIPMYFYILWGFLKLGLYALAAYGVLGVDPFEGIIYCMVLVHVFGGVALILIARREFNRLPVAGGGR